MLSKSQSESTTELQLESSSPNSGCCPWLQYKALPLNLSKSFMLSSLEHRFLSKYSYKMEKIQNSISSSAPDLKIHSLSGILDKSISVSPQRNVSKICPNWTYHFIPQNCSCMNIHGYSKWGEIKASALLYKL